MRITLRSVPAVVTLAGVALLAGACTSTTSTPPTGASAPATTASSSPVSASTAPSQSPTMAPPTTPATPVTPVTPTKPSASASKSAGYPVDLQPGTAAPGSQVSVYGLSCTATTGTAVSQAFTGRVALAMLSNATGGIATVKPGLAAGRYTVTVICGSITATGTLTVS
jgi:cytoskeletal protein RodZ